MNLDTDLSERLATILFESLERHDPGEGPSEWGDLPERDRMLYRAVISDLAEYYEHCTQPGEAREAAAAIYTLKVLGYTYHGGAAWRPPLGPAPDMDP